MKISYNWLKNYVDFNLSPKDLAEVLTGVGLEVEDITLYETIKGGLAGVVVGEVMECTKHPDADKLSVTKVNTGTGELLQIVCGAPNVAVGQKVVVALVGSTLFTAGGEKLPIKKAKIRGVESYGMICAEDELGLSTNHEGIMVLPVSVKAGTAAADYFKIEKDFVFEIGLTPNRGDANSHIGVARDVAAALNIAYGAQVNFSKPDITALQIPALPSAIAVEVVDADACPRYSGIAVGHITVAESPEWLKNKLQAIGLRPINNVVDITNFVLHEYGQPLHAFDADKITGNKVLVKKLMEGTPFKTLDEKEIKLSAEDLMICHAEAAMCIAGVFGGANSGVTSATKNVFLESAYFRATGIRKTAARLGLRTDAATHYEKGTDPNITVEALKRAAALIVEICGGEILSAITDVYPNPIPGWHVTVSCQRMIKLAGFNIEKETIRQILQHLEIKIEKEAGDEWQLLVPAFKTDVKREADIVEELIRILGYNSFPLPKRFHSSLNHNPKADAQKTENLVANQLSGAGFSEIWTNSVTQSTFEADDTLRQQQVKLLNSQTDELDSLRTSLLYSGLEVVAYNQNRKATDLRLYEFGKTYHRIKGTYHEENRLAILLSGKTTNDNWLEKGTAYSFYHLKSTVLNVLARLGHTCFEKEFTDALPFNFGLLLKHEDIVVASLGSVAHNILAKFNIKNEVFFADLNWKYLVQKAPFNKTTFSELPKFPTVTRDLALVVNHQLPFEEIEKIARAESKNLLREVSLFDVYQGEKIEKGKKSYAVSFVFQHPDKTLTDTEVEKIMKRLMNKYETDLQAIIRKS